MNEILDILSACQTGNWNAIEVFLNEGINPNCQNNEGETLLQIASANGYSDIVNLLLNRGALIDLPNNYGWTPLMHAARHGHSDTVSLLLKMKAKVNITNKLGLSPIVAAAWSGDFPTLRLLIEAGAMAEHTSAVSESNECDLSSLMAAAAQGQEDMLRFLIDEGALVNHVSPITGLSPLMLAASEGHTKLTRVIVKLGGNTNYKDICGRSALNWAIESNRKEVAGYLKTVTLSKLKTEKSDSISILQAVRNGDILSIKCAIKENPEDVNFCDPNDGITPLMLASMLGQNNVISLLASYGADLDAQDIENGWTALMYAVFHRQAESVQLLLDIGVSINVCASNGYTVMDIAQHTDCSDTVIMESLTCKLMSMDQSLKKSFTNSPTLGRRNISGTERFYPKGSQTQTGLKSWIGGVAQNLQTKMLTRLSPRYSEKLSASDAPFDETMVNDVFADPKSPCEEMAEDDFSESWLPPHKYLAEALKEHKVEAIEPPLKVIGYSDFFPVGKPKEKKRQVARNYLHLKYLLRDHCRERQLNLPNKRHINEHTELKCVPFMDSNTQATHFFGEETSLPLPSEKPVNVCESKESETLIEGELSKLLQEDSLSKYFEKFKEQEIDTYALQHLSKEDMNDIGVESIESQEKLLEIIQNLKIN